MSVYSIYFSPAGGTKKVIDRVTSAWSDIHEIDLSDPLCDYTELTFSEKDICIVAFPVYEGRVPTIVLERVKRMKAHNTPCILVAVFGNRAVDDALLEAKNELISMDFFPFAAVSAVAQHSILPMYGVGRPDVKDIAELRSFSEKLKIASSDIKSLVNVPGKSPYIVINIKPTFPRLDAEKCIHCMSCADKCPANAISRDNLLINTDICARCVRCVSVCPTNARYLDAEKQAVIADKLAKLFEGRKPNSLYI